MPCGSRLPTPPGICKWIDESLTVERQPEESEPGAAGEPAPPLGATAPLDAELPQGGEIGAETEDGAETKAEVDDWAPGGGFQSRPPIVDDRHSVEIKRSGNNIVVFGAYLFGIYVEAFDGGTGESRFRFSDCYWGHPFEIYQKQSVNLLWSPEPARSKE